MPRAPDGTDEVPRLERFRQAHPEVAIGTGIGYWQAVRPEPNGTTTITRYLLGDLLDALAGLYGAPDPDSG